MMKSYTVKLARFNDDGSPQERHVSADRMDILRSGALAFYVNHNAVTRLVYGITVSLWDEVMEDEEKIGEKG